MCSCMHVLASVLGMNAAVYIYVWIADMYRSPLAASGRANLQYFKSSKLKQHLIGKLLFQLDALVIILVKVKTLFFTLRK